MTPPAHDTRQNQEPRSSIDPEHLLIHDAFVRGLARSLVRDDHGVDDLVQDTWVAAIAAAPKSPASLKAWLKTAVRFLAGNRWHRERRHNARQQRAARPYRVPSTAEIVEREEARRHVVQAVLGLPEPYRSTMLLRFFDNMPPREIAEHMGVPVETVRTRTRRSLVMLRTRLDSLYDGDRKAWCTMLLPLLPSPGRTAIGGGIGTSSVAIVAGITGALLMTTKAKLATVAAVSGVLLATLWMLPGFSDEAGLPGDLAQDPGTGRLVAEREGGGNAAAPAVKRPPERTEVTPRLVANIGSLRIRILYGDDNSPVPDIGVVVRDYRRHGPRAPDRHARTDASGEVLVAGLPTGEVSVFTSRMGLGFRRATVVAGKETEVTLTWSLGVDVTGVVVNTDGVGVAGATVVLAGLVGENVHAATKTAANGTFSLRQIPREASLGARAKGYAPSPLTLVTAGAGAKVDVRIVLPGAGGSVRGRVLDPQGVGVANAMVNIGPRQWSPGSGVKLPDGGRGMRAPRHEVRTDSEGKFLVEGLKPDTLLVDVITETFALWSGSVKVQAHETTGLAAQLSRGVVLEGIVRNEKNDPVAGADVEQGDFRTVGRRQTRTAKDGSFRLLGLPAEKPVLVKVRSKGLGRASKKLQGRPGETLRWDVTLSRGLVMEVKIIGRDGKPLPKAFVQASAKKWGRFGDTDAQGRFEMIQCPPGPVIKLEVHCRGYEPIQRMKVDAATGPLVLHMKWEGEPTARIVGQVVDPDGKAVTNAMVLVRTRGAGGGRVENTTAEGKIKLETERPGFYRLSIRAGGYVEHLTEERQLGSGETWDLGQVRLQRGGRLLLDLKVPREREKARVWLVVCLADGRVHSGFDSRKRPLLSDPLAPGRHYLRVAGPQVVEQKIPFVVRAGEETRIEVEPRFAQACVLQFVLPAGSDRVHQIKITVTGAGGFRCQRTKVRIRQGPFKHEMGLVPGRYTVSAVSENGHRGQAEFQVKEAAAPQTVRVLLK